MPNRHKLPLGIDPGYLPVWEEFNRMKAVDQLRKIATDACLDECFKLLLNQSGAKYKLALTPSAFVNFNPQMQRIKEWFRKYGLHRNLKVKKHNTQVQYVDAPVACAALNVTMVGTVTFTCGSFGIKYVLSTLDNRAWRNRPMQLSHLDYLGRERKFAPLSKLKPKDFYCIIEDDELELHMARTETEIILQYKVYSAKGMPAYKSLEKDLKQMKRLSTIGVFQ